ncbi:hypothetical protein WA158_005223 [Blastocystis sp. Blastoise]
MFATKQLLYKSLLYSSRVSSALYRKTGSNNFPLIQSSFFRYASSTTGDVKCMYFAVDDDRAQESLAYWLSKNSNITSLNAQIRKAYLPFYCFSFDVYTKFDNTTVATSYNDIDKNKRSMCQIYAGSEYNRRYLDKMKSRLIDITTFSSEMMDDVDEVDPWSMYRSTAWKIVQTAVEEEEKAKLAVTLNNNNKKSILNNLQYSYTNVITKRVYIPVFIAESSEMRKDFCVYISGITGIPSGHAYHMLKHEKHVPLLRIDKTIIPAIISLIHMLYDWSTELYINRIYHDMMRKEKLYERSGETEKLKELHRKQFSYEAKMRRRRERFPRLFDYFEKVLGIDEEEYESKFDDVRERQEQIRNKKKQTESSVYDESFFEESYYDRLDVPITATTDDIKRAFQREIKKYHPDFYKGPDSEEKSRAIIEAYFTLRDRERRKEYDKNHGYLS